MSWSHGAELVGTLLGGLALFLLGMQILSGDLRRAAGARLRTLLGRAVGRPVLGLSLGVAAGFAMHSSGATVMIVGFVDAGLMTLQGAVAPILGANIGTTLAMQLVSLRLEDVALPLIAAGFLVRLVAPRPWQRHIGGAVLGFGLLFLGLKIMKGALEPHRDQLRPWLELIDGSTWSGLLRGTVVAAAVTAVIQSSGATIGMALALISAGALVSLDQAYPIVLGAHIGTCATALIGSVGRAIDARRAAAVHLIFNLGNVLLAIVARPIFIAAVGAIGGSLGHQTVNLHTMIMVVAALLALPATRLLARAAAFLVRRREPRPEPSYLDQALLNRPEQALAAVICELRRVATIALESLDHTAYLMLVESVGHRARRVVRNEQVIDEIKIAMHGYLLALTRRRLSRRQAILIQHLDRCMIDIERIGDHIDRLREISALRLKRRRALVDRESLERLFDLHHRAREILALVIASLDAEARKFAPLARRILAARDAYVQASADVEEAFRKKQTERMVPALAGVLYIEYVASLDRIVRHARSIALVESHSKFRIKPRKLDRVVEDAEDIPPLPLLDPDEILERFHREDPL